jgi:DMSO/TMAO reductase YedYZ molybdopterin-dependent catalytic subunit
VTAERTRPVDDAGEQTGEPRREATTSRRRFVATVGVAAVGLTAVTAGQSVGLLDGINLFGPRTQRDAPQGVPVNRTAAAAAVKATANDPAWTLRLTGANEVALSRTDLLALPQTTVRLPIACVEGWSVQAEWTGVRVRDLMALVGGSSSTVRVTSLEPQGVYRVTELGREFVAAPTTLVALGLNGETLSLDHGYPARLIAPNRPGVLQTKWLSSIEVLP